MTDGELEHRLTAVENRARSNTHRLDDLKKLTDAVNGERARVFGTVIFGQYRILSPLFLLLI